MDPRQLQQSPLYHSQTGIYRMVQWLHQFHAFDENLNAQRTFDLCDFQLLASLANPCHDKERLWTCAGTMILFFVFDEYSDIENAETVRKQANIIMDALRNPSKPRPKGEIVLGEITRQFWDRAIKSASPSSQKRFIETFDAYTTSVVEQALDRDEGKIRNIREYFDVRRKTIGAEPSFVLLQLDMDISDEVLKHPMLAGLTTWIIDMLILGNDICSYNIEQARNDDTHNIITIVMHELKHDIHGALSLRWAGEYHDALVDRSPSLRAFVDMPWKNSKVTHPEIGRYVDGLMNWVRANDSWSFESTSSRYFGRDGLEICGSRVVELLPRHGAKMLPVSANCLK